jgi:hypothetical protein
MSRSNRPTVVRDLVLGVIGIASFVLGICVAAPVATAQEVTVPAASNIFGAGHASPPEPGGGGGGLLPVMIPIPPHQPEETQAVVFDSVTGEVTCCYPYDQWNGPDGGPYGWGGTNINSYGGISGMIDSNAVIFLAGVFVTDAEPADPAPVRLDFSEGQIGTLFTDLLPALNQTFFIGDGHANDVAQVFHVPEGATRLFLGFLDAQDFMNWPGYYDDNAGDLQVAYSVVTSVPSPTAVASWGRVKSLYR